MKKLYKIIFIVSILVIIPSLVFAAMSSVSVTADATSVAVGQSTTIRWNAPGATHCYTSVSPSVVQGSSGSFSTGRLNSTTTFSVRCDDNPDYYYYQLYRCYNGENLYEIGPFPAGTYNTGDMVAGAVEWDGRYDYIITGSTNYDTSRSNIQVSRIYTSTTCR